MSLLEGIRVLGAHIDSPRLDVKQNPLYEKDGFALLDTHYYGGIKKYQWVTIPLAIYGVVCKKDGTTVDVMIGDKEDDPVLGISDLLVHLSQDQMQKMLTHPLVICSQKYICLLIVQRIDFLHNYMVKCMEEVDTPHVY